LLINIPIDNTLLVSCQPPECSLRVVE